MKVNTKKKEVQFCKSRSCRNGISRVKKCRIFVS